MEIAGLEITGMKLPWWRIVRLKFRYWYYGLLLQTLDNNLINAEGNWEVTKILHDMKMLEKKRYEIGAILFVVSLRQIFRKKWWHSLDPQRILDILISQSYKQENAWDENRKKLEAKREEEAEKSRQELQAIQDEEAQRMLKLQRMHNLTNLNP